MDELRELRSQAGQHSQYSASSARQLQALEQEFKDLLPSVPDGPTRQALDLLNAKVERLQHSHMTLPMQPIELSATCLKIWTQVVPEELYVGLLIHAPQGWLLELRGLIQRIETDGSDREFKALVMLQNTSAAQQRLLMRTIYGLSRNTLSSEPKSELAG